jgi:hypothetical protein
MSKRSASPLPTPDKIAKFEHQPEYDSEDIIIILDTPSTASSLKSPPLTAKYSTYAFYNTNVKRKLDFSKC